MNLFFDLDGTLVDCRLRLYTLFTNLSKQTKLNFDSYWDLKRSLHNQKWILKNILNYTEQEADEFKKTWLSEVEKEEHLSFDTLFEHTIPLLEELKPGNFTSYIVTARQNKNNTIKQLKKLNIQNYFTGTLIATAPKTKTEVIRQSGISLSKNDFIIGDTIDDIETGKQLSIKSVAVLSGIQNFHSLASAAPDYIINHIGFLPGLSEIEAAKNIETEWK